MKSHYEFGLFKMCMSMNLRAGPPTLPNFGSDKTRTCFYLAGSEGPEYVGPLPRTRIQNLDPTPKKQASNFKHMNERNA